MSGQLASEQQGNVAETHRRVNVVTEVEAANEPAYRADIDAEIYSVNTHSEVGSVTDVQLALNLRLTSTQLAAPVVFSLLTSVESTNGIVNTSTMQGYLNRTALSAADLQSLVRSKFLRRHIDRLGAPNEPLTDPGN